MVRLAPLSLMLFLLSTGCAVSATNDMAAPSVTATHGAAPGSRGRCDYGLEGAVALGAGVAVLKILQGDPAEQLIYMVPISAGVGWLSGRFLMPPRPRCRVPATTPESSDTVPVKIPERGD